MDNIIDKLLISFLKLLKIFLTKIYIDIFIRIMELKIIKEVIEI